MRHPGAGWSAGCRIATTSAFGVQYRGVVPIGRRGRNECEPQQVASPGDRRRRVHSHHLVTFLKAQGHVVRGVDLNLSEHSDVDADDFEVRDLRRFDHRDPLNLGTEEVVSINELARIVIDSRAGEE